MDCTQRAKQASNASGSSSMKTRRNVSCEGMPFGRARKVFSQACLLRPLKRLIRPTLGFQSMRTARATIKGFEVMRMFKKGQFKFWIDAVGGGTEARFINHLFG